MERVWAWFLVVLFAVFSTGCEGFRLFVSTGPLVESNPSPTALPAPRPIVLGEVIRETFVTPEVCFDVRAPSTGLLFVRLGWDSREGDIDFSFVSVVFASHERTFASPGQTFASGSIRVTAGQTYRIAVVGGKGGVPFTLTTSMD